MRAIIIEEDRFAEIAETLKAASMGAAKGHNVARVMEMHGITNQKAVDALAEEIHRAYHFHFVRWAQSHGARCVKP